MISKLKYLFLPLVAMLLLSSCGASEEEMSKVSGDEAQCDSISEILDFGNRDVKKDLGISKRDKRGELVLNSDGTVKKTGVVTWMVDKVTDVAQDATMKIYFKIALNLDFRFAVAMMITLAIILFASSVILGLVQANGYNMLMFLLKLIIIYQLSINYYYFNLYVIQSFEALVSDATMFSALTFSDYFGPSAGSVCMGLVGAVCDVGGLLNSIFGIDIMGLLGLSGITDQITVFGGMDRLVSFFFDFRVWKIILMLCGSFSTSAFWGIMLAGLAFFYLLTVIVTVKTFLMATVGRYVLYGVGPIFISFALFRQTYSLFDGWLRQLISFTLQPVFLFIFLGMFHSILMGFIQKIHIDLTHNIEDATIACTPTTPADPDDTCTCTTCVSGESLCEPDPANPTNFRKCIRNYTMKSQDMCVAFGNMQSGNAMNFWKLCSRNGNDLDCNTDSIKPMIPIDIWVILSALVICYLMISMCSWVTEIANTMAGGMVSIGNVQIQGWRNVKSGVSNSVNSVVKNAFRGGVDK